MIHDLHSHTYYSACGRDKPEVIIQAAIDGGIEVFGISDHNYGIGDRKREYYELLTSLKEVYKDRIKLLCGIEVCTLRRDLYLKDDEDISCFDYCLVENLDSEESVINGDIAGFAKRAGTKVGIAHTNLFRYIKKIGKDPLEYFKMLADNGIFWEMNVNYDSIHGFRIHQYYLDFLKNEEMQDIVRKSGVEIGVGFDGHRVEDYLPERVVHMSNFLKEKEIQIVDI